jgi:hypothetical protein
LDEVAIVGLIGNVIIGSVVIGSGIIKGDGN